MNNIINISLKKETVPPESTSPSKKLDRQNHLLLLKSNKWRQLPSKLEWRDRAGSLLYIHLEPAQCSWSNGPTCCGFTNMYYEYH